jgi:hypothetical protein
MFDPVKTFMGLRRDGTIHEDAGLECTESPCYELFLNHIFLVDIPILMVQACNSWCMVGPPDCNLVSWLLVQNPN